MSGELTTSEFWDDYWEGLSLPTSVDSSMPFDRCFSAALTRVFTGTSGTVLEVGCAPGKWLAFLARRCGLEPAGIEYSREGMEATRRNLELQGVDAPGIVEADFLALEPEPRFDGVASYGFIEHFDDPVSVLDRHLAWLAPGGLLVIGVPNFRGLHGALQRALDPTVVDKHNLDVMCPEFFLEYAQERGLVVETLEYLCGFEPALPIVDPSRRGLGVLAARAVLWAGRRVRRNPMLDRVNGPRVSAYLLFAARSASAGSGTSR